MDKIPDKILDELKQRGAKQALPDREPDWYTMAEIAIEYGATANNKDFKSIIDRMVADGLLERRQVYDRKKCTKCIVYRLTEKEKEDDPIIRSEATGTEYTA